MYVNGAVNRYAGFPLGNKDDTTYNSFGDQDNYKQDLSDLKRINIDIFLSSKISALA